MGYTDQVSHNQASMQVDTIWTEMYKLQADRWITLNFTSLKTCKVLAV